MQSTWRVACVRVPSFALGAVWERAATRPAGGHWDDRPLALARAGRVAEATRAGRRAGARLGAAAADARARCPTLTVLEWDETAVTEAVVLATALFVAASGEVTPVAGAPGLWWASVGTADEPGTGERGVVRALARLARRWHPRARVAVASSCVAARAAVWGDAAPAAPAVDDAVCVVPRGACAAFIAPAPLGFIPMDPLLRRTLAASGVRTAGALAALDPGMVADQWGAAGLAAWRLAAGEDPRRPVATPAPGAAAVVVELATPAATVDGVIVLVRAAVERLVVVLATAGRQPAAVALTLAFDDGRGAQPAGTGAHTVTRELRLPCPLDHAAPIAARCRAVLLRWPLPAAVCGLRVAITATAPLPPRDRRWNGLV